jgi:hypothetical protein
VVAISADIIKRDDNDGRLDTGGMHQKWGLAMNFCTLGNLGSKKDE